MWRKMIIGVWGLTLAAFLAGCGAQAEKNAEASGATPDSPLVRILAGDTAGSGVIFECGEDALVILTAVHVLQSAAQTGEAVEVLFGDGTSAETDSCILSQTSETAFVNLPLEKLPWDVREADICVAVDKEAFDGLTAGAAMSFRGFGSEGEEELQGTLLYPWIYVEDFHQYMLLVQGAVFPGMSGGGLFDGAGNFVGILCGVNDSGETAAVPLSVILAEYAQEY